MGTTVKSQIRSPAQPGPQDPDIELEPGHLNPTSTKESHPSPTKHPQPPTPGGPPRWDMRTSRRPLSSPRSTLGPQQCTQRQQSPDLTPPHTPSPQQHQTTHLRPRHHPQKKQTRKGPMPGPPEPRGTPPQPEGAPKPSVHPTGPPRSTLEQRPRPTASGTVSATLSWGHHRPLTALH